MMTEKSIEVLKKVYNLAYERRIEYKKNGTEDITIGKNSRNILEAIRNPAEDKLIKYLNELDFETIKMIQTVMYLGRDNEYSDLSNGEQRYLKLREDFDKKGWKTKDIEISQIKQKVPLDKYLKKGLSILGVEV